MPVIHITLLCAGGDFLYSLSSTRPLGPHQVDPGRVPWRQAKHQRRHRPRAFLRPTGVILALTSRRSIISAKII